MRHAVQLDARIVRASGELLSTRVLDLSLDGCKVDAELRIGEQIEVTIARLGAFLAIVRWSTCGKSGTRFLRKDARVGR
ncbi:PilZ domain-containing protein [uncultured Sphingomonas sp.]|uniref:PilZ domain-containing protein n=1 Tax=uncultured Sphingomonas sp. TaxID=158754 RepID=UPI0025ED652E|nr:PilZ domain-containing protein [uncultured Sphingomonas sp.]